MSAPGPWCWVNDKANYLADGEGNLVAWCTLGDIHESPLIAANARLIAAAPELYEALRGILEMAEDLAATFPINLTDAGVSAIEKARAALAKAEGIE